MGNEQGVSEQHPLCSCKNRQPAPASNAATFQPQEHEGAEDAGYRGALDPATPAAQCRLTMRPLWAWVSSCECAPQGACKDEGGDPYTCLMCPLLSTRARPLTAQHPHTRHFTSTFNPALLPPATQPSASFLLQPDLWLTAPWQPFQHSLSSFLLESELTTEDFYVVLSARHICAHVSCV